MKNYMYNYINEIENKLNKKITKEDLEELKIKISFFSHERLIHLLITLFFALISIIFTGICLSYFNYFIYTILLILYVMDIFYIIHYYRLENGVQYLYKLYDKMNKKIN